MTVLRLHQLNDVKLVGRLTRDPELRYTPKGQALCRFDLAVNRRFKDASGEWRDDAAFIPVVVWRESAERCRDRLKKGSPVYVEGRLRSRNWETKEGQKRSGLEVEVQRVQFLEKVGGGEDTEPEETAAVGATPSDSTEAQPAVADDGVPF